MFPKISSHDIERWATSHPSAPELLPELLRRLVCSQPLPLTQIDFPAGRETQRPGYDGTVYLDTHPLSRVSTFIPNGASVWELSVNQKPETKAQEDYEKRSGIVKPVKKGGKKTGNKKTPAPPQAEDDPSIDRAQTVYVVVTAQRWPGCGKWAAERSAEGIWREVRAYDASSLEQWLEIAPAVGVWFARQLGRRPEHFYDALGYLRRWQEMVDGFPLPHHAEAEEEAMPSMSSLLLAGRADEAQQVRRWALHEAAPLRIHAERRDEAIAFVCAALASPHRIAGEEGSGPEPAPARDKRLARLLVVTDAAAMDEALLQRSQDLILLPDFAGTPRAGARGAHMLVVTANPERADLRLAPQRSQYLARALHNIGVPLDQANQLAFASRGLHALRRALGMEERPEWANDTALVSALLLGQWTNTEADWATLARLSERDAATLEREVLHPYTIGHEPPLEKTQGFIQGEFWRWRSRRDAWGLLKQLITESHLRAFKEIAVEALRERPGQRSDVLTEGIAVGIALLATDPPAHLASQAQSMVNEWTHRIIHDADAARWAMLGDISYVLAEAAPEVVMQAIETTLSEADARGITELFDGTTHHSGHGLMRALRLIAWSPIEQLVTRCIDTLSTLQATMKWQENDGSQPRDVISDILHPRWAQCSLPLKARLGLVKYMYKEPQKRRIMQRIQLGWLEDALAGSFWLVPLGLTFRSWDKGREGSPVPPQEHDEVMRKTQQMFLKTALTELDRWSELLDRLVLFQPMMVDEASAKRLGDSLMGAVDAIRAHPEWEAIAWNVREQCSHLFTYNKDERDEHWRRFCELVRRFYTAIEPGEEVRRKWLFVHYKLNNPDGEAEGYSRREELARERRSAALRDLLNEGTGAIEAFIDQLPVGAASNTVAAPLAFACTEAELATMIRDLNVSGSEASKFWHDLFWGGAWRATQEGQDRVQWIHAQVALLVELPEERGDLLLPQALSVLPMSKGTLDLVFKPGNERLARHFWSARRFYLDDTQDADVAFAFIRGAINEGRWDELGLQLLDRNRRAPLRAHNEAALRSVMQEVLRGYETSRATADELEEYMLQRLHDIVIELGGYDLDWMSDLEVRCFDLLRHATHLALYERLASTPSFFVELLSCAEGEYADESTYAPPDRYRASKILSGWSTPSPGSCRQIIGWADEALRLATNAGIGQRGASRVGAVLARLANQTPARRRMREEFRIRRTAPARLASAERCVYGAMRAACTVLDREDDYTKRLRSGFIEAALRTMNRVRWVGEGSTDERPQAARYRRWADMCGDEFYNASLVLREVAARFDGWALHLDDEAAMMRRQHQMYYHAGDQQGVFSIQQAEEDGFAGLIPLWRERGQLEEVQPGVYQITGVDVPALQGNGTTDQIEQARIALWLWSRQEGVFSHATALRLHGLSDVNPEKLHMTLPLARCGRARSPDEALVLHFAEVGGDERQWFGGIPATHAARTVNDCAAAAMLPDLVKQAVEQGLEQGLFSESEIEPALAYLEPFVVANKAKRGTR